MKALFGWMEDRVGLGRLARMWFLDPIPGGARWRHTWFTLLAFAFFLQAITGFFLWAHYSPSTQTAWENVHHLQRHVPGGWFLRGLHHHSAQAFVLLLLLHVVQLVVGRLCRPPRELAFWVALALVPLAVGMSVTGWLLPYDQHGYWAARVPLNLVALTPGVGEQLRSALLAGPDVSHLTLTRFVALHTGLLPLLLAAGLAAHWLLSWRQVYRASEVGEATQPYWPSQAWMDAVVCVLYLNLLAGLVFWTQGAALGAPADAAEEYSAARPEWFFLALYQFLKYFRGTSEVWGAIFLPGLLGLLLALMPFSSRFAWGHRLNVALLTVLLGGATYLTLKALQQDRNDPVYLSAVRQAQRDGARAKVLANGPAGIPREGALALLRQDPLTRGPRLFARHCASCHRYDGHDGMGRLNAETPSAPDLQDFASREWLTGLLDPRRVGSHAYFGGTKFAEGKMVGFVKKHIAGLDASGKEALRHGLAALSAEAQLKSQREIDQRDAALIAEGRRLLDSDALRCTECHQFRDRGSEPSAPDLTGYGSRQWLIEFIRDPAHERFYGRRNDRMPRFGADEVLDAEGIGLIADWLRGEWPAPAPGDADPAAISIR